MNTQTEFEWCSVEIEKVRRRHDRAWTEYSEARNQLDRLERKRGVLFIKLMEEADERARLSAG